MAEAFLAELRRRGHELTVFGPLAGEKMLWPTVARRVAESVARGEADEGVLFSWTGTGVSLAANKVPGIRAALCADAETARGARGILFNVTGGSNLSLFEVNQAAAIIKETAHPEVNLIFGAVIDPAMGDELRVTVIATGFDLAGPKRGATATLRRMANKAASRGQGVEQLELPTAEEFVPHSFDMNDLDIPAFLRRK